MEAKKAGQRLTLEEMFDIFEQDVYKEYREEHGIEILHDDKGQRYIKNYPEDWWRDGGDCPLILAYILAEQMNYSQYGHLDLNFATSGVFSLRWDITLISLWVHPLVWAINDFYTNHCVLGYGAISIYVPVLPENAYEIVNHFEHIRVVDIFIDAGSLVIAKEDDYKNGIMKGMHQWHILTADSMEVYRKAFMGEDITEDDYNAIKLFSAFQLRSNLLLIAQERGGKFAAEVLRLLQEEWPMLKQWKNALRNMTKEDIDDFEECLYHGFDDLLAEWEKEAEQNTTRGPKETTMFKDKETAERETKRFLSFINHHKMSEDDVDAAYDNRVNQVAVCFYRIWKEKNYLTTRACGTSLSRFIVDCGLSISVKEKAHGNVLNKMIKSNDLFANWIGEVRASFQN